MKNHNLKFVLTNILIPFLISFPYRFTSNDEKKYNIKIKSTGKFIKLFLKITGECKFPIIDTMLLRRLGIYENETSLLLDNEIQEGYNIVELGAAIGYFTVQMSKLVGNKGKIYSFEPNKSFFNTLKNNISLNSCENVKLFNCGIGNNKNILLDGHGNTFSTETFDSCLKDIKKIDFIFIDIDAREADGSPSRQEYDLIKNILKFNEKLSSKPSFFIEYIENDNDYISILNLMEEYNYKMRILTDRHFYFYV